MNQPFAKGQQASPTQSDILTCNLTSQNGSPKINQDAVKQLLYQGLTTNQIEKKNKSKLNLLSSPSETTNRTDKALPIQIFPTTTKNVDTMVMPDWSQVLDESSSAIIAFGEDIC